MSEEDAVVGRASVRVRVGWAAGLLVVAALEFAASFDGVVAPIMLVLAVLAPFALVWGGVSLTIRGRRVGSSWPALLTVLLAAVVAWTVLGASIGDAVPRLLTTARPAAATAALLTPVVVLVVLVSAVVAACVLATETEDGQVAGLLAPVLGAAVVYTAAQLLSAGTADPDGVVAACLLVVVVAGWSTPYLRRGAMTFRPVAVLPLLAGVLVAVAAAALVPSGAFDPREHVSPPTVRLTASSPLTQLAVWGANPGVQIFQAHVTGTDRLHLATLGTFTGADWQVDDRYREVGLSGAPDLAPGTRRTPVTATVRITQLGGVWLPSAGTATSTSLPGAVIDSDDGTLARTSGVRPGETYTLHSAVDSPTDARLSVAPVPVAPPARYLALPNAPIGFAQYARAAIRGASTPLEEAVAIEHAVATNRSVSTKSPTGSSYARLQNFLFTPAGRAGAQVGTSEQFAAAFAVLGREVGLPTRLVVGFTLPAPNVNGTSVVHGSDATVWPEVYFTGAGWVPFSPTPGSDSGAGDAGLRNTVLQRLADHANDKQLIQPPITPPSTSAPHAAPTRPPTRAVAHASAGLPTWAVVLIVVGAGLLLIVLVLLLLRGLRAARHRRLGARGAWAEFVDLLVLLGRRPSASEPAPEVAAAFDSTFDQPGARAARLAIAADRDAFAPAAPGTDGTAELWRDLRVLRRRARGTVPHYRRALWRIDPRPLLDRRR